MNVADRPVSDIRCLELVAAKQSLAQEGAGLALQADKSMSFVHPP